MPRQNKAWLFGFAGLVGLACCPVYSFDRPVDETGLRARPRALDSSTLAAAGDLETGPGFTPEEFVPALDHYRRPPRQRRAARHPVQPETPADTQARSTRTGSDDRRAGEPDGSRLSRQELEAAKGTGTQVQQVGQAPVKGERKPPIVPTIPELGGVLTPRGNLVIEPAALYSHSSVSRFNFLGVSFFEALLIGLVRVEDVDRDFYSAQLTGRYGVTSRLEAEVKVPYIYRNDSSRVTLQNVDPGAAETQKASGDGLGDIEFALHYQINRGLNGWPFFVGNVRYKSNTGKGPFDIARDAGGLLTELPTGSGFHSIEPSVTILYPSDPAVLFANFGYLLNIDRDINKNFTFVTGQGETGARQRVGNVGPGDTFRMSFGLGHALNERLSLTLGYKQDFIQTGTADITQVGGPEDGKKTTAKFASQNIGSLLFGIGYAVNKRVSTNLNLELGITRDAPDVIMTLRLPITAYRRQP